MSLINNFVDKIGTDKALHFLCGAVITFVVSNILSIQDGESGILTLFAVVAGMIVSGILELIKEYIIDDTPDTKDILATMLGTLVPFITNAIGLLFQWLS